MEPRRPGRSVGRTTHGRLGWSARHTKGSARAFCTYEQPRQQFSSSRQGWVTLLGAILSARRPASDVSSRVISPHPKTGSRAGEAAATGRAIIAPSQTAGSSGPPERTPSGSWRVITAGVPLPAGGSLHLCGGISGPYIDKRAQVRRPLTAERKGRIGCFLLEPVGDITGA